MKLVTDRLILREHELCDYDRFYSMLLDPVAKEYTGGVTALSYDERLALYNKDRAKPFTMDSAEFAIIER